MFCNVNSWDFMIYNTKIAVQKCEKCGAEESSGADVVTLSVQNRCNF